jgi:glycosyltransferase involved in cell wall biosynthesis
MQVEEDEAGVGAAVSGLRGGRLAGVPKVSVHMPAYNHEKYIGEAISSALAQRANFEFEIVIGDDHSTDGTLEIALDFAKRYPSTVRVLAHDRNVGIWDNDQTILRACRGEYIAWLEGDDVWTSTEKLQKQVDLLEHNRDYSACFHWAGCLTSTRAPTTWRPGPPVVKPYFTIDDFLEHGHFVPSCTAVFRAALIREPLEWTRQTPFLERTYFARFAMSGKIGFIDEELAMFRHHGNGIYARCSPVDNIRSMISVQQAIADHFGLWRRRSCRRGLAGMHRNLSAAYRAEGALTRAVAARLKASMLEWM